MYQIIKQPNYFSGTIPAHPAQWITESDVAGDDFPYRPNVAEWMTEEEAHEWIDSEKSRRLPYFCGNGEAGRPEYEIVKDCHTGKPDCKSPLGCGIGAYDDWTEHEPSSEIKAQLDALNVDSIAEDFDDADTMWYAAEIDGGDGYEYRILYRPSSLALQLHCTELEAIHWDNAGYYRRGCDCE